MINSTFISNEENQINSRTDSIATSNQRNQTDLNTRIEIFESQQQVSRADLRISTNLAAIVSCDGVSSSQPQRVYTHQKYLTEVDELEIDSPDPSLADENASSVIDQNQRVCRICFNGENVPASESASERSSSPVRVSSPNGSGNHDQNPP